MKTAKEVLTDMVETLNAGGTQAELLWNVVTALRGPDSDFDALKFETISRLRGALGLNNNFGAIVHFDLPFGFNDSPNEQIGSRVLDKLWLKYPSAQKHIQYHFCAHYANALRAMRTMKYLPEVLMATISTPAEVTTIDTSSDPAV